MDEQKVLLAIKKKKLQIARDLEVEARAKAVEDHYKNTHKIEFFADPVTLSDGRVVESPFPHQRKVIEFVREGKKTILMQGANQIGKTIIGSNLCGAFSEEGCIAPWDKQPTFPSEFAKMNNGREVIGRILCNDWEKAARDTIVPKLKEWLRDGTYETKKNNVGVEHEFYFPKSKSKFTILTYKEDTKSHEGWTGDWVWADEPPPKDKYVANRRGLVARNGLFFISMTAISEAWILDDIVLNPDPTAGIIGDIPITANPTLDLEAIRIFEKDLSEDEKTARIKGGWLQLTGRIWKCFDMNLHVIRPRNIPPDWPVSFQIDFHLDKPHAISFMAVDEYGRHFVIDEVWRRVDRVEDMADEIIRRKIVDGWRIERGEIDALAKGDTKYISENSGRCTESAYERIEGKLLEHGILLGVGSKAEASYIACVEGWMKNDPPLIHIFNTCTETIKQVSRWSYDDNGKPKSDGHFPECIGRFSQMGLRYYPMRTGYARQATQVAVV